MELEYYTNYTSPADRRIFEELKMKDPESTSMAVIGALSILNSLDSITILDFPKIDPIFKLAIVQAIKDQPQKDLLIKQLKVLLTVLSNKYNFSATSLTNKILNILFTEFKFPSTQLTTTKVKILTSPFTLDCENVKISNFTKQKYQEFALSQIQNGNIIKVDALNYQNDQIQFNYPVDIIDMLAEAIVAVDITIKEKGREAAVNIPTISNISENLQNLTTK